jgi:hypothetical protein
VRLLIVFLLLFSGTMVLFSIYLLPSYFLSRGKVSIAEEKVRFLDSYVNKSEESGVGTIIRETNEKIKALKTTEDFQVSELLTLISSEKNRSVQITGFTLRRGTDDISIFVNGTALSRAGLIAFNEALKSIGKFSEVELPISNLAKNENINFNIKINIKTRSTE